MIIEVGFGVCHRTTEQGTVRNTWQVVQAPSLDRFCLGCQTPGTQDFAKVEGPPFRVEVSWAIHFEQRLSRVLRCGIIHERRPKDLSRCRKNCYRCSKPCARPASCSSWSVLSELPRCGGALSPKPACQATLMLAAFDLQVLKGPNCSRLMRKGFRGLGSLGFAGCLNVSRHSEFLLARTSW